MIYLILLLAFLLRLVNLNQSFWLDEAAQVIESARSLSQQLNNAADFHPPLYHLLLHFWMKFGTSEVWIRFLSIIFSLASIYATYSLARLFVKKRYADLAAFFLSLSPFHLWYSQEARPYMLLVALSTLTTLFLLKKKWFLYALFLTLSLYTLYFTPFLLLGFLFYILFFELKNITQFLTSTFISLLFFIPYLPKFMEQLAVGTNSQFTGWTNVVSESPWRIVPLTFAKFIFGKGSISNNLIYAAVILPVFMLFLISLIKNWHQKKDRIIMILFFVPFVLSIMISFFIPVVAPQRMIFLLPLFYLILALGIQNFKYHLRLFAILLIITISMSGILQYYFSPAVQREKWREAITFIETDSKPNSLAIFVFPQPFAPYQWYNTGQVNGLGIAPNFILTQKDLINLESQLDGVNKLYFFQYLTGLTDPQGLTISKLSNWGYSQKDIKNFEGVGFIYIYEK